MSSTRKTPEHLGSANNLPELAEAVEAVEAVEAAAEAAAAEAAAAEAAAAVGRGVFAASARAFSGKVDTDLGFTRDRQSMSLKSATADLSGFPQKM
jgi:hypothetical protein